MRWLFLRARVRIRRKTRRLQLHHLEDRTAPAIVTWDGGGGNSDWNNALNWYNPGAADSNTVPGASDDVVIGTGFTGIVHGGGSHTVNSITSASPFTLSGGTLGVTTTIDISTSAFNLGGGTLTGAIVQSGTTIRVTGQGSTLSNATVNGDVDVPLLNGYLAVTNGLTLNGTAYLGTANGSHWGGLGLHGTQTIGGTGSIVFGGHWANGLVISTAATTVTLGADLTVHGRSGHLAPQFSDSRFVNLGTIASDGGAEIRIGLRQDGAYGNAGSLDNQGTLSASGVGSVLYLPVANWNNTGAITATGGGTIALVQNGVNSGPISANGGTVTLDGSWTNTGALTATSNGVVNLQGTWTNSGPITATSSTVNFNGTWSDSGAISLTGSPLNFRGTGTITVPVSGDAASAVNIYGTVGSLTVTGGARLGIAGGRISNGTVTLDAGQALRVDGYNSTLSNVVMDGDVDVPLLNGYLAVTNGLTLNGTAYLGTANGSHWGGLGLHGTQTIGGTGSIVFGGHWANGLVISTAATTVTLGADLTVHGRSGHLAPQFSDSRFVNLGTIASDGGAEIRIGLRQDGAYGNAGSLDNQGTLSASGVGSVLYLPVANWNNTGAITATGGGTIALVQNGVNSGPISANGGTVTLDGSWTNTGALTATSNGVVNLQGTWTNSGPITATSSTVNFNGTWSDSGAISLTGSPLNFRGTGTITVPVSGDAASAVNIYGTVGSLTVTGGARLGIAGGRISNGTVTLDAGQALRVDGYNSTLSNVVMDGDVDVPLLNGYLAVTNGLTLNGTAYLGTANGSHWGGLGLHGTQTIGGTGSIVFGGHWANGLVISTAATTVTLGADLTVHGRSGHLAPQFSDSRFVNLGTIASDGGAEIRIGLRQDGAYGNAGSLDNQGTLSASGVGSVLYLPVANWNNTGAITATGGGTIALVQNGVNSGPISANGGTVTLDGSWTNTGALTATSNGVVNLQGTWTNSGPITATSSTVNFNGTWSDSGAISLTGSPLNFRGTGTITVPVSGDAASAVNIYGTVGSLTVTGGARLGIAGGRISNGTVTLDAGQALRVDGYNSTLSNVVMDGDVDVPLLNGYLAVTNGLTLNGTAYLGTANGSHWGGLGLHGTQTIGGTGSIVFGGHWANGLVISTAATTVTLGADLTVHGRSGHLAPQFSDSRFVNLGTIASDGGAEIRIGLRQDGAYGNAGSLDNQGTLSASGVGSVLYLPVANWNNTGAITATGGGTIALVQNGVNSGPISANGGTVSLSGTWSSTGTLTSYLHGHTPPGEFGIPGVDYGQFIFAGSYVLTGTLKVQLVDPYVAKLGEKFLIIDNRTSQSIPASLVFDGLGLSAAYAARDGNDLVVTAPVVNVHPIVDAGGPYTAPFGGSVVLSGAATDPNGSGDIVSIVWDLDADGVFGETGIANAPNGDEVGRTPTLLTTGLSTNNTHTVTLRVTDQGGLVSEDTATVVVTVVPELTIGSSDITFSPINPSVGQLVTIQATVRNLGQVGASNVVVRFLDFGITIGEVTIPQLAAGSSTQVSLPTGFNEASHRLITVKVDPGNTILELNEQNNEASQVLQVGQPELGGAAIVVTAGSVIAYQGRTAWVTGQAFYDFTTVPGTNDFPVQGARVTVTILDDGGQSRGVFTGAMSNVSGVFAQLILAPNEIDVYTLRIEVTDGTVTTLIVTTLDVRQYVEPPPPPPSPPPPSQGGHVDDVAVSSQDIIFSEVNPGIGEPITILARLWHIGPTAGIVPVTVNDVFPVAGVLHSFPIGTTTAQLPASSGEWVYVGISLSWMNSADGAHVIQVVAAPEFTQPTSNDEATRLIYVGTPPADLDIAKSVELLVDADGNSLVTPGDTLRYTIQFGNTGDTDVTGAVILDDYNEALLELPFGLSLPGTIAGGTITWNVGAIAAGDTGVVTYDVQIKPPGEFPLEVRTITNNAILDTDQTASLAASATINVVTNSAPVAQVGGPYSIFEGDTLALDASSSSDPDHDTLTFAWDINGDGVFTDATGATPTLTWAQLNALSIVDGPAARNVRVQVSDGVADPVTSDSVVLTINNKAPTPTIHGAPSTSSEGTTINLTASASDPSLPDMSAGFTFIWHVVASNGQTIADGSGANFEFTPNDNGTYVVTLTAMDKDNGSASTTATIEVTNVDPTVTFSGPGSGVRGQNRSFGGSFSDPGSADTWTATVNYGDGSGDQPLVLNADKTFAFHHTYENTGTYTITVTVRDDEGGIGTASRQIAINVVEVQANPCDPSTTDLVVGGTTGDDAIAFAPFGDAGAVEVTLNGVSLGAYSPTGRIVAFAQAGNDDIQTTGAITRPAWLFGGGGNDRLKGGGSHDVLVGGDGDDLLVGGQGRDLLIGGFGSDRIVGNADEDILVAGRFTGENDHEALCAIMDEWTRTDRGFAQRVEHLTGQTGGGYNGETLLNLTTVLDDGVEDVLTGSSGQDWFLFSNDDNGVGDRSTDLSSFETEFAADLDFIEGP